MLWAPPRRLQPISGPPPSGRLPPDQFRREDHRRGFLAGYARQQDANHFGVDAGPGLADGGQWGRVPRAAGESSKPPTATSSGTRRPAWSRAVSAPWDMNVVEAVWEPTWTAVTGNGWDPADPSSGDAWENHALFDYGDRALPAMRRFNHR
jgi:hypothetical protein